MLFSFFKHKQKTTKPNKPILPLALIVMDGYGISPLTEGNAVRQANTPNLDYLQSYFPKALVHASGNEVGLPYGEAGNSEVGHLNIGAGRIVYQPLLRVSRSLQNNGLDENLIAKKILRHIQKTGGALHLAGLLSAGGVHSHIEHLVEILSWAKRNNIPKIYLHIITDGRDSLPAVAQTFIQDIEDTIRKLELDAQIVSVCGRLYSMDRDTIWKRTQAAYDAMIGKGKRASSAREVILSAYARSLNDEFIEPHTIVDTKDNPLTSINNGDALFFFNIRPDRSRQLARMFSKKPPAHSSTKNLKNVFVATLTEYDDLPGIAVVLPEPDITYPLGEIIATHKMKQLRIAETQKYAHVTYFFNGGIEKPFAQEKRVLIPSLKIANFSKNPEMSTREITTRVIEELNNDMFDFAVINFANADMVGHTGDFAATKKAIEVMDDCIGQVVKAVLAKNGCVVITSDHGNAEEMLSFETGSADTEHNIYPVPCMIIAPQFKKAKPDKNFKEITMQPRGTLSDIAPTILDILKIKKPAEMTGVSLLDSIL